MLARGFSLQCHRVLGLITLVSFGPSWSCQLQLIFSFSGFHNRIQFAPRGKKSSSDFSSLTRNLCYLLSRYEFHFIMLSITHFTFLSAKCLIFQHQTFFCVFSFIEDICCLRLSQSLDTDILCLTTNTCIHLTFSKCYMFKSCVSLPFQNTGQI